MCGRSCESARPLLNWRFRKTWDPDAMRSSMQDAAHTPPRCVHTALRYKDCLGCRPRNEKRTSHHGPRARRPALVRRIQCQFESPFLTAASRGFSLQRTNFLFSLFCHVVLSSSRSASRKITRQPTPGALLAWRDSVLSGSCFCLWSWICLVRHNSDADFVTLTSLTPRSFHNPSTSLPKNHRMVHCSTYSYRQILYAQAQTAL